MEYQLVIKNLVETLLSASYALVLKKLLPVVIEEVDLPLQFKSIQTLQLNNWDDSDSFPGILKLVAGIVSFVGEPPAQLKEQQRLKE